MLDMNLLYKAEDGCNLRFYEQAAKNTFQSERQGRPIYDQVLYVEVIAPGSKESSPVFELMRKFAPEAGSDGDGEPLVLKTAHYDKYKQQIKAYQGDTETGDMRGTPLSAWPAIDAATAATLAEGRVYTVEALAALPDTQLRLLGPQARTLVGRAQVFLNAAAGNAMVEGMTAEIQNMREEMDRLRNDTIDANARAARAEAALQGGQAIGTQQGMETGNNGGSGGSGGGDDKSNDDASNRQQGTPADADKGNGASGEGRETGNDTARAPNSQRRKATDAATAGAQNPANVPAGNGAAQSTANPQGGNALPPII